MISRNEYILDTCLEAGWITLEQAHAAQAALERLPKLSVLDLMIEQELLDAEQVATLRDLLSDESDAPFPAPIAVNEPPQLKTIDDYLTCAARTPASDLHLSPNTPPMLRLHGKLTPLYNDAPKLRKTLIESLARKFLKSEQIAELETRGALDACHVIPNIGRFRVSAVRQQQGWELVFRVIRAKIPNIPELGLPDVAYALTHHNNGLVLITGTTGSGKSTTLAAMVQHINQTRHDHIVTLEDPIEYLLHPIFCQISQREIHSHTASFATALRAALREDPDVIMVGEMRDLDTISLAIMAAETGHLVLSTLHTSTAARTLDRLLDVFPAEQQSQVRTTVSESLRGIICQQLVPRADGNGRALAVEVLINNSAVSNLIREGKTFMIPGVIQTEKNAGMRLMDDSLNELFKSNVISHEELTRRASTQNVFA